MKNRLDNTEYQVLVPFLLKNSNFLGRCWIGLLQDHTFLHTRVLSKKEYKPFLDGIQSAAIGSVVQPYLHEVWPVILQAVTLDAAPAKFGHENPYNQNTKEMNSLDTYTSGCIMVQLEIRDFSFLWGLAILILFEQHHVKHEKSLQFSSSFNYIVNGKLARDMHTDVDSKFKEVALYAIECLSKPGFYDEEMLSCKLCLELLQMLMYPGYTISPWTVTSVLSILEQVLKYCPDDYINDETFLFTATELCMHCIHNIFGSDNSDIPNHGDVIAAALQITESLVYRLTPVKQTKVVPTLFHASYKYIVVAPMGTSISAVIAFLGNTAALMTKKIAGL